MHGCAVLYSWPNTHTPVRKSTTYAILQVVIFTIDSPASLNTLQKYGWLANLQTNKINGLTTSTQLIMRLPA